MPHSKRPRPRALTAAAAPAIAAAPLVLTVLLAVANAALSAPGSGHPATRHTAAANRRVAAREATTLLGRLQLPTGATRIAAEPHGDGGVLSHPAFGPPAATTVIARHRWWTVRGTHAAVTAFIRAHRPRGADLLMSGPSIQGPGAPAGQVLGYKWPAVPGVLWSRQLAIAVVDLPGGLTGVRGDGQVQWTIPRAADERIPPGVHELDVTRRLPGTAPTLRVSVVDLAQIRKVATMIDQLEIVQPEAWSCPAHAVGGPVVTFTFRARLGGPALAVASESASATEPTPPCYPMTFSIRGHSRKPLLGGAAVVRAAGRMLGVRLHVPIHLS
jgi:hypothetical protein